MRSAGCVLDGGEREEERNAFFLLWRVEGLCESRASWSGKENVPSQVRMSHVTQLYFFISPALSVLVKTGETCDIQSCFFRT